jgi:DNA-binding LacI/PurR family transcriptional regulator
MRDVAERAGVSRSLVSTVFRGVPGASPATRERVLQAATDLGYRPDERARQLRSHHNTLIGVTLTATQPFHVALVELLHDAVDLRGYELSITFSTDTRTLARATDGLLAQRCAAMALIGPTAEDAEIAALARTAGDVPIIVVDRWLDIPEVDALRIDDAAAMRQLVGHLVGLGHREIWHASGEGYVSADPRLHGYLTAMAEHGLANQARVVAAGGSARDGAAAAMRLLSTGPLPSAVVAYNDRVACGMIDVLWRQQVRIPQDISVVGFDNIAEAAMPHMDITTIEQRPEDLAGAIVDLLLHRLGGEPAAGLQLMPPGPLVVRSSSGPPPLRAAAM